MYPRTLFKDKQEAEQHKKEKEFNKLKEKSKTIIVNSDPKTIRDKMIALLAEQNKKAPNQAFIDRLHGEIFYTLDHVPTDFEEYKAWVEPRVEAKKKELAQSQFAASTPAPELGELKTDEEEEKKDGQATEESKGDAQSAASV